MSANPNAGASAEVSLPGGLRGAPGFQQLVAQARLSGAREGTRNHDLAANQVREIRTNAQLRTDEWVSLDDNLIDVAREELMVIDDLRGRGLTVNEDLSTLIREFEKRDDFGEADVDMEPETRASEDALDFTIDGVPLPIVHKSFHIPFRKLLASRERGESLDTSMQSAATRSVAERLENLVFNGWTNTLGGYDVPGLLTESNRNTATGNDWSDTANVTGDDIRNDIIDMIDGLENDNYRPGNTGYVLYIDRSAFQQLRRRDTGTDQERGLLERLREEFSNEISAIRPSDFVGDGEALMFAPRDDVVELAVAADMQNVEWMSNDGFRTHMKVMASITPIVKSDSSGQSGIFHTTGVLG